MADKIPEKARLLQKLMEGGFNVPPFIYLTQDDFKSERFEKLEAFLARHCSGYKVIARSAHPQEEDYKGGTLSLSKKRRITSFWVKFLTVCDI